MDVTFDQLVKAGQEQGVPQYNGLPWSFTYEGLPVSHENDDTYLISFPDGSALRVAREPSR